MADPVYTVSLEAAVGSLTNVSSDVNRFTFDRTLARIDRAIRPDNLMLELMDSGGRYSPRRGGSIGAGLIPGRKISITATYNGSSYPLFYGRIQRVQTRPGAGDFQKVVIEGLSDADRLQRTYLTTSLFQNFYTGSIFTEIMSRSSVSSFYADTLNDQVPFCWYRDVSATAAMQELVDSGNYLLFIDGAGTIRLKSRHAGFFSTSVASLNEFLDFSYTLDPDTIINQLKLNAKPRAQVTAVNTIAFIASPLAIPASGHIGFWLTFQDPEAGAEITPVGSMITPVASQDYYASANSDGTGSDFTSTLSLNFTQFGSTIVCSLFNGTGSIAYLTRFQLRGYPVRGIAQLGFKYDASSSQGVYGLRSLEIANALIQNYNYLRDLAQTIVEERKAPQDGLEITLVNQWPDVLTFEVSNTLALVNSTTGVNSNWLITGMSHEVTFTGGLRHEARYQTEYFQDKPWLILDHAQFGKLDSGRLLAL